LGLLWEEEILFLDFFFPNPNNLINKDLRRFFQEIEEGDFLEEYRPNLHFAKLHSRIVSRGRLGYTSIRSVDRG
jgi:hypothetical protein